MHRRRKDNSISITIAIILAIAVVILLGWLTSCNSVHKLYNKQKISTDSTHSITIKQNVDSFKTEKKIINIDTSTHNYVSISFNTDTQLINTPVLIKVDSNGTYVINAGYRKINEITINKDKKNILLFDSLKTIKSSTINIVKDTTHFVTNKEIINKSKVSSRFPLSIIAGIVALIILLFVGLYIKKSLTKI